MSTTQWIRKASLVIGQSGGLAIGLSDLRFVFHVQRGDLQTPNSARIRIYNVSPDTAQQIEKEYTRVVLQAGYEGNYGVIFDGTVIQVRRGRETPTDTYLDITAADGDMAYNFAVVNTTLAAGSTVRDHLNACVGAMGKYGVTQGYVPDNLPNNPLPRGKVMFGMARDFLTKFEKSTDTLWSIQDGQVQIAPMTSYVPGDIPVINAATGMIGMPEQTQNGISVKMLLNPMIKIGRLIQLDNSSIQRYEYSLNLNSQPDNFAAAQQNKINGDGFYLVMTNGHTGDTRGNEWYTDVVCLAVDASGSPEILSLLDKANKSATAPIPPTQNVINPYG
ncbi:hypothetical protein C7405_101642 [Paraburkholderia caballeronis]|uniref:phage protein n=1 Tax=Paraburkholderia caballeronis TaxID=416943 RepID=UPI001066025A|nr:hypothetical protein [Paraburkholderia caballeronis]TDV39523.1 hypothetical protein C7405_101642 [Paraburkholderia caballeronis]